MTGLETKLRKWSGQADLSELLLVILQDIHYYSSAELFAFKEQLERLFEELGITDCRERYPDEMSGGQKQRVAIARALVTRPAVLFADEPTGNLDAENAESVAAILSRASMRYGQTIVMVTHDRQMADYADRILSMENIVACMK